MKSIKLELFFSLILMIIGGSIFAQKIHSINLQPTKIEIPNRQFYISKVIDNRRSKQSIGVVQKGAFNKKVNADFDKKWPFELHLQNAFNKMMPFPEGKTPIIISVKRLFISEKTLAFSEYGMAEVELEFLTKEDQLSYGIFKSSIETKGMDVSKKHPTRILAALKDCIQQFANSDWQSATPQENLAVVNPHFPTPKNLKVGLYRTFSDLAANKPTDDIPFKFVQNKGKVPTYNLVHESTGKRIKTPIWGGSDGTSVFLQANAYSNNIHYHFVKAHFLGEYIYFEDKFSSQMAGVAFGLIGSLASIKHTGIVLDTKTGMAMQLDDTTTRNLLQQHPELLQKFEKSNKNRAAKKALIRALNRKLKEQQL